MAIVGHQGKIMIGDTEVAQINQWSLDVDVKLLEATPFGETWEKKVPGLKSWSGKASGWWDMSDAGQRAVQEVLLSGSCVTLKLYTNATNHYYGTALIKTINVKASAGDLVEIEISFEGTGPLSYV